jgi:hypothetical protein
VDYAEKFYSPPEASGSSDGHGEPSVEKHLEEDLLSGKVDVIWATWPHDLALVRRRPEFGRLRLAELHPDLPGCRQMVPRERLQRERAKYVRFERAFIRAARRMAEKPVEADLLIARFLGVPYAEVPRIYGPFVRLVADPDLTGTRAFAKLHRGGNDGDYARPFVDTTIYRDALRALLREEPDSAFYRAALERFQARNRR